MILNKDTKLCISISKYPSNFGTILHNYAYELLDLNFIYKSFSISNLLTFKGIKALNIRLRVSMPYKSEILKHLDKVDLLLKIGSQYSTK